MQEIIEQVIKFSKDKKHPKGFDNKSFSEFIRIFYEENIAHDFINRSVESLYNGSLLAFNFFINRKAENVKISISNPSLEVEGFDSAHTFINIINDDKSFLVDSIVGYLDQYGIRIKEVIHPIFPVIRDAKGNLKSISNEKDCSQESFIQLRIDRINSERDIASLKEKITKILENVALVVNDWKPMVNLLHKAASQIDNAKKLSNETSEIKEFLAWAADVNFIILGAKEFDIKEKKKDEYTLKEVKNAALGVFRSEHEEFRPRVMNSSFEEVSESIQKPYVIEVLKSRYRSQVHRFTNAERIRVQKISPDGKVVGEFRFVGLFTSSTYNERINSIPLIRGKVAQVVQDSNYAVGSNNYKDLLSVLEFYPRDELFQISAQNLLKNATGIVAICGRSQVRFFARKDKFNRFVSCLVFIPRHRSNSDLRIKIRDYLSEIYQGEIADSFMQITDSNLIRLHIIVRTNNGIPEVEDQSVENQITKMSRVWSDDLTESIAARFGDEKKISFFSKYKDAFSVSYKNRFDARRAAIDIGRIEECLSNNTASFNLYKSADTLPEDVSELKIYSPHKKLILSDIMPILESFGFNVIQEHTYTVLVDRVNSKTVDNVWIHYFHVNLSKKNHKFSEKIRLNFKKTVSLIWAGVMPVEPMNALIVSANLHWKQIYMLQAYSKYLHQIGFNYAHQYICETLTKNSNFSRLLVKLFELKFDPLLKEGSPKREDLVTSIEEEIEAKLKKVKEVADDAVIRKFYNIIRATLRTNYYQSAQKGGFKGYVSFKFDCKKIPNLPLPIPHAEIFVYSTKVEAIHLRGGKVARGGLRWSDRHEDFRTEVLGLMKAQMTKNAVIVPVGSKGGFVVKRKMFGLTRDEMQKEAIECYKTFLSGLLDVTDNVIEGKVKHPESVIRYDDEDPYLVVAADKGTATFSDIANSISEEYNFWLGDAFASGGSVGYDHKKMGITAKGAWISVMHHFRNLGIDSQSEEFSCAGIGDMAGDVFGNGMLLSKHIKLVAAFNHMHIFLDPEPNVKKSFAERSRMFKLPRSSWTDYDQSLISKGGGIFDRKAKSIKITPEIRKVLDITAKELTPNELIKAILKAPVGLLWNGGIGTYLKATSESDSEVGDPTNDVLRVNGSDLRCQVIGEGGNLGFTQKGRIEYALNGGQVNTDAMDNSAGVDCSDHEVNIKIALTSAMLQKKITIKERNKILESMTDEVSDLVLNDNRLQNQAIAISNSQGSFSLGEQSQFLNKLEKSGFLNREIEFLPSKKELSKRQIEKVGLSRPELCVMLSYSKMDIYTNLLASDLVKDEYFKDELFSYFPKLMQKKFIDEISSHQLRDEIIATQITNFVVNRLGITFVNQVCQDSGFSISDVVRSIIVVCDSFRLREVWEDIEALDGKVNPDIQIKMFLSSSKLLERSVLWLLRNKSKNTVSETITRFRKIADELSGVLSQVLAAASKESFEKKIENYCQNNVSKKLASRVAAMDPIASAFDIAEISAASSFDLKTIAKIYFAVGTRFSLKWLRIKVSQLTPDNHSQKLSNKIIIEDLYTYQMQIAKSIVDSSCNDKDNCEVHSMNNWIVKTEFLVERFDGFIEDLKVNPNPDLSVFIVALNRLKPFCTEVKN